MSFDTQTLKKVHRHCATHREEVMASTECGRFSCASVFAPPSIDQWIEETGGNCGKAPDLFTAFCPECGIDSVIGDASPFPATDQALLHAMHAEWFGADKEV